MKTKNLPIAVILFFIFTSISFGQDAYKPLWKQADSLKAYGYLKSSLAVVNKNYDKSKAENEYGMGDKG